MKVLVDIDGTLCKFRWFGKILLDLYPLNGFGSTYPNNGLKKAISYVSSWFYDLIRAPNEKIIKEIRNLDRKGYAILVFSAVPDIKKQRRVIEKWLRKNRIPFKKIFLMRENETPTRFKIRIIKKIKPNIVYENNLFILEKIFGSCLDQELQELIVRIP